MAAVAMLRLAALAAVLCQTEAVVTDGTPMARVISLLGKLEKQIGAEGAKEAAEYDKFACWCKEQADTTLYNIETSKEKISGLDAALSKLDADILELAGSKKKNIVGAIEKLEKLIAGKEKDIADATTKRGKENKAYTDVATEIADAVKALEDAIKQLKGEKAKVKNGKMNLLQDQLLEVLSRSTPTESQLALVQELDEAPADPAKNHAYTYKSNDIIGTLEKLLAEFKLKKKDANMEEKDKLFAFDSKKLSLENEVSFADQDRIEKVSTLADLRADHAAKKADRDAEQISMDADDAFMKEVTADCEEKARNWDKRSTVRSDELTAIGQAMEQLKGGVSSNYGSNALAASFLQMRSSGASAAVVAQVASLVSGEATRLKSATLTGLSLKLSMGGGFDKVVKLIEDLIKKLQDEAKAAAASKGSCDKDMAAAVAKRDKNKLAMEDQGATIAMKNAEKLKLAGEVENISKEIAELSKAALEATELRSEEKAANAATTKEANAGKEAIDSAIKVLNDFYGANAFLQGPGANRDGDTVASSAPKLSYSGDYKGKQDASKGIIGILEVVQSDFQRTISNTASDESQAAGDFTAFETKNKKDSTDKTKLKGEKEDKIKSATRAITNAKDSLKDADKLMNVAVEELEKVTAMCLTGEGTFAERKKQREDEIKALQGAMKILQDWKA